MGAYISGQLITAMLKNSIDLQSAKILVMGLTFKENCPDMRNTKVIDIIDELSKLGPKVECYDPWVDEDTVPQQYQINQIKYPSQQTYDAIILAVSHEKFITMGIEQIKSFGKDGHILYDLKYLFSESEAALRL